MDSTKRKDVLADDLNAVGDLGGPTLIRPLRVARQTCRAVGLLQLSELLPCLLVQSCLLTARQHAYHTHHVTTGRQRGKKGRMKDRNKPVIVISHCLCVQGMNNEENNSKLWYLRAYFFARSVTICNARCVTLFISSSVGLEYNNGMYGILTAITKNFESHEESIESLVSRN